MTQIHKLEVETEVKCSADKFYSTFKNNVNHILKFIPEYFKGVQVLEGDGKNVGTIRLWKNVVGGNTLKIKEKVEAMDAEDRSITFNVIGEDTINLYKTLTYSTFNVIGEDTINLYKTLTYRFDVNQTKDDECSVKWTLEFVKDNEDVPAPNMFLEMGAIITKGMARLLL